MRPLILILLASCYHYEFRQRGVVLGEATTTYSERTATWLNGLVGAGVTDTTKYCANPVKTELRVEATDVLLSIATLLVYTPHTLYVTCPTNEVARAP